MQGEWSKGSLLPGSINDSINANYPYVLTDGATIYYAADGENSIGGYDIFVTCYNTNTNTYLTPEYRGHAIQFLITTIVCHRRVQQPRMVCFPIATSRKGKYVFTYFIPNSSKRVYNYEAMDKKKVVRLAQIHLERYMGRSEYSIWCQTPCLQAAISEKPQAERSYDFEFVIDDHTTYYQWSDFKSPQAKSLFSKYRQLEKSFRQQQNKLKSNVPCTPVPRKAIKPNWLPPYSTLETDTTIIRWIEKWPPLKCVIQKNNPLNRKLWTYLSSLYSFVAAVILFW